MSASARGREAQAKAPMALRRALASHRAGDYLPHVQTRQGVQPIQGGPWDQGGHVRHWSQKDLVCQVHPWVEERVRPETGRGVLIAPWSASALVFAGSTPHPAPSESYDSSSRVPQDEGGTHRGARKTGEASLSSLTRQADHTTLSSNALRSRGSRGALWEADRGEGPCRGQGPLSPPRPLRRALTAGPSEPGDPFSPAGPGGPGGPTSPGRPAGPVSPRGPLPPSLPAGPGGPGGPAFPWMRRRGAVRFHRIPEHPWGVRQAQDAPDSRCPPPLPTAEDTHRGAGGTDAASSTRETSSTLAERTRKKSGGEGRPYLAQPPLPPNHPGSPADTRRELLTGGPALPRAPLGPGAPTLPWRGAQRRQAWASPGSRPVAARGRGRDTHNGARGAGGASGTSGTSIAFSTSITGFAFSTRLAISTLGEEEEEEEGVGE